MKKYVDGVLVDLSKDEVAEKQADEKVWSDGKDERTANENRITRNFLLQETDWTANSDVTMSAKMKTYRKSLRDLPTHKNWPNLESSDWPTKPS